MIGSTTSFEWICKKFYDRIEKDEKFFNYYNIDLTEAISIAAQRAENYLIESLDELSNKGIFQVDFSNYDETLKIINFKLLPKEVKLIVETMFLTYMKRDQTLLHAMEINFTPSDLTVLSPGNERTSYRKFIHDLSDSVDSKIDDYKNRDRKTGKLQQVIDYSQYNEE